MAHDATHDLQAVRRINKVASLARGRSLRSAPHGRGKSSDGGLVTASCRQGISGGDAPARHNISPATSIHTVVRKRCTLVEQSRRRDQGKAASGDPRSMAQGPRPLGEHSVRARLTPAFRRLSVSFVPSDVLARRGSRASAADLVRCSRKPPVVFTTCARPRTSRVQCRLIRTPRCQARDEARCYNVFPATDRPALCRPGLSGLLEPRHVRGSPWRRATSWLVNSPSSPIKIKLRGPGYRRYPSRDRWDRRPPNPSRRRGRRSGTAFAGGRAAPGDVGHRAGSSQRGCAPVPQLRWPQSLSR